MNWRDRLWECRERMASHDGDLVFVLLLALILLAFALWGQR
jgi:hypothetical protein